MPLKISDKTMKKYDWILFDADETLFHFDSFQGLCLTFSRYDAEFTPENYKKYQTLNKKLWTQYQNGAISARELQITRFATFASELKISPEELNHAFLNSMAEICKPLDGAVNLLSALNGQYKMGIVTNGFTELQEARLNRTGLRDHFEIVVISEQIGVAKPNPRIFDHALSLMGDPLRKRVLMVGDTLETDILGGNKAGINTCWLNREKKSPIANILFDFEVTSLLELQHLLFKE